MNRGKNIGARILRWGLSALTYLINLPIVYLVFNLFPQSMQDVALGRPLYALAPRPLPPTPLLQRCLNYLLIIVVVFAIDILVLWCLSKLGDVKGTFTGSFEKGG